VPERPLGVDRRVEIAAQRVDHHHRDDREGGAKEHHLADRNGLAKRAHQRLHDGEHERRGELEQDSLEDIHLQRAAGLLKSTNRQRLLSVHLA
jgi:hypothetical protein